MTAARLGEDQAKPPARRPRRRMRTPAIAPRNEPFGRIPAGAAAAVPGPSAAVAGGYAGTICPLIWQANWLNAPCFNSTYACRRRPAVA